MKTLDDLLANNRTWSARIKQADPAFFKRLAGHQSPQYLWVGCSDSRVPANEIVGLAPGELFVHRNVANLVLQTDLNALSVMQYAVEALQVRHIIVCGHYGCGGVRAACENHGLGLIDNWLREVRGLYLKHAAELDSMDEARRLDRLCELNVMQQVANVCATTIVQDAWGRGQDLSVHGLIYDIGEGTLHDLDIHVTHADSASGWDRRVPTGRRGDR